MFFVKKFAKAEIAWIWATFRPRETGTRLAENTIRRGRKPVSTNGLRLARMLRPHAYTMYGDFSSMMPWGRSMMAPLRALVDISRDWSAIPGFFVLFSCVKFFTNRWVPTVARSGAERKDQYAELCDPGQM